MASFAAKYLVSNAASGVTSRVGEFSGDLGKQLSMENLTKKDLEKAEKILNKEERDLKKKHYMIKAARERLRSDIRRKYGIKKRRAHQPVETHTGILTPKSAKNLERAEKELDKKERGDLKKKHYMMEAARERLRSDIRRKYGIKKRRAHQPVETHSGILTPKSEKELLLVAEKEEEEDDDCTCSPCSCTWASLCCPFLSKNTKHS